MIARELRCYWSIYWFKWYSRSYWKSWILKNRGKSPWVLLLISSRNEQLPTSKGFQMRQKTNKTRSFWYDTARWWAVSRSTLNVDEKLVIARQPARLGVDVIEAGFAFASPPWGFWGGWKDCKRHGKKMVRSSVAWQELFGEDKPPSRSKTGSSCQNPHIYFYLRHSLGVPAEEIKSWGASDRSKMVAYAKSFMEDVEFSPMDAARSDQSFFTKC